MQAVSRALTSRNSIKALMLCADHEKRLRNALVGKDGDSLNFSCTAHRPIIQYEELYIAAGSASAVHDLDDFDALMKHCLNAVAMKSGLAESAAQHLHDAHDIIYTFDVKTLFHVIGFPCLDGTGRPSRRTLLCHDDPSEVLLSAPSYLLKAISAVREFEWARYEKIERTATS